MYRLENIIIFLIHIFRSTFESKLFSCMKHNFTIFYFNFPLLKSLDNPVVYSDEYG